MLARRATEKRATKTEQSVGAKYMYTLVAQTKQPQGGEDDDSALE